MRQIPAGKHFKLQAVRHRGLRLKVSVTVAQTSCSRRIPAAGFGETRSATGSKDAPRTRTLEACATGPGNRRFQSHPSPGLNDECPKSEGYAECPESWSWSENLPRAAGMPPAPAGRMPALRTVAAASSGRVAGASWLRGFNRNSQPGAKVTRPGHRRPSHALPQATTAIPHFASVSVSEFRSTAPAPGRTAPDWSPSRPKGSTRRHCQAGRAESSSKPHR